MMACFLNEKEEELKLYEYLDCLLADASHASRAKAYAFMKEKLNLNKESYDFLWRMAKTTHLYVESLIRTTDSTIDHKPLQFEGTLSLNSKSAMR